MSLINDALKRVKAAQQQAPPSASVDLHFKPVEATPPPRAGAGSWVPVIFAAIALGGLALGWRWLRHNDSVPTVTVRASEPGTLTGPSPLETRSQRAPSEPMPASSLAANGMRDNGPTTSGGNSRATAEPVQERSPVTREVQAVAPPTSKGGTNNPGNQQTTEVVVTQSPGTNDSSLSSNGTNETSPVLAPAAPKPPPLKLQGIVFNPRRPSAVINGRTVFIGDRVREMRIVAIGQDSATLAGAGRTNVLRMAE